MFVRPSLGPPTAHLPFNPMPQLPRHLANRTPAIPTRAIPDAGHPRRGRSPSPHTAKWCSFCRDASGACLVLPIITAAFVPAAREHSETHFRDLVGPLAPIVELQRRSEFGRCGRTVVD